MSRPVLLITGASSGIGAATARLAAASHDLALGYHSNHAGIEAVARDCTAEGATVHTLQADLADPAGVEALFAGLDAAFGRLDGLVNNAGVVDVPVRVDAFDAPRLRRMLDTNLLGPILVAGQAVRRMSTARGHAGGGIVNVSSAAARLGGAGQYVDYAAAKAGIDLFTRGLAEEVAAEGIRVNAVRPGLIETPIHAKGGQPGRAERLAPSVPMRRVGTAGEVAETILWLLSPAASYVTASVVDCAGGR